MALSTKRDPLKVKWCVNSSTGFWRSMKCGYNTEYSVWVQSIIQDFCIRK